MSTTGTGGVPTTEGIGNLGSTITLVAPAKHKSLATKLAEVMAAVHRIPKRGWNDHFKYKFATESDVVDRIRRELSERNIILVPAVTDAQHRDKGLVLLSMKFTFVDGETNERIEALWMGSGIDTQDKAVPKAMTSGEKYFLLKMFLIPTGDDPDAAGPVDESPRRAKALATINGTDTLTAAQVKRVKEMLKTHNTNVDEFKAWVQTRFGYGKATDIQQRHYDAITRYIVEGLDVTGE